jgi:hypothetical protein
MTVPMNACRSGVLAPVNFPLLFQDIRLDAGTTELARTNGQVSSNG